MTLILSLPFFHKVCYFLLFLPPVAETKAILITGEPKMFSKYIFSKFQLLHNACQNVQRFGIILQTDSNTDYYIK